MPIRFRCPSCQQLLGIARRKAGSYVNCPTCRNQVLVPAQDEEPAAQGQAQVPSPAEGHPIQQTPPKLPPLPPSAEQAPALFERDDFDALLRPPPSLAPDGPRNAGALLAPPPPPANRPPRNEPVPMAYGEPEAAGGLVLSSALATLLTVGVILLLAMAFGAGLLVGRFL